MAKILSKQEYYKTENEFVNASVPYADYLEYIQNKQEIENASEYVVWVTGGGEDAEGGEGDDEESSGPCGDCAALDGQVFHYTELPEKPHENCKCGTMAFKTHVRFEKLEEGIKKLEEKFERERKELKQKQLDKFKKSNEIRQNIEEAKKMRYSALRSIWFANREPKWRVGL